MDDISFAIINQITSEESLSAVYLNPPFTLIIVCFLCVWFWLQPSQALWSKNNKSRLTTLKSKSLFPPGLGTTTVPSTANTMAVTTLIPWPQVRKRKNTGKLNLTLDVPGFPGGAGGGFPSKGSDYPGGAASSYFNTYASYYSQTGAPYRWHWQGWFVEIKIMQDSEARWSQSWSETMDS